MPERLTDSLVQKGLVTRKAADEAIDRLVLMGGALDTCLLELRLVDEATVTAALADAYEMEAAGPELLTRDPDPPATRAFPEQWAKKHVLAPVDLQGNQLRVLSPAPADIDALRRLGELLELELRPILAPEFRVQQRLSTLYGAPTPERYLALVDRFGELPVGAVTPGAAADPTEPNPVAEPLSTATPDRDGDDGEVAEPKLNFGEAVSAVSRAQTELEIAEVLTHYASQWLRFVALLRVDGSSVQGWMGIGPQADRVPTVEFDLQEESAFSVVVDTRAHYLGPLPSDQVQSEFLGHLRRPAPRMVLIVPVRIRDQTVGILYADNAESAVSPRLAADLMLFVTHVQTGLEALREMLDPFAVEPTPKPEPEVEPLVGANAAAEAPTPTGPFDVDMDITLDSVGAVDLRTTNSLPDLASDLDLDSGPPILLLDDGGPERASPSADRARREPPRWADPSAKTPLQRPYVVRPDPVEPRTEPSQVLAPPIGTIDARTADAAAMPTHEDGRFDAVEYRGAVVPEPGGSFDLFAELDRAERASGTAFDGDPIDSGGWEPVDAGNWDELIPPQPPARPSVETLRGSLTEDATVPDLSAEAWIRASSEFTKPKPLSPDVVQRSALPEPDSDFGSPVPPTRVSIARRTVAVGEVGTPMPVFVEDDDDEGDDLLDFEDDVQPLAEPAAPFEPASARPEPAAPHPEPASARPEPAAPHPEAPPVAETAALVDDLTSAEPARRSEACDRLTQHGALVLPLVMARFPGVLTIDPFAPDVKLPAFSKCGVMMLLLERCGRDAHEHVVAKLDDPNPMRRFFAIYFYAAVYVPEAIPKLIQRLHDEESRISMLAARTLFSYRDHRDFRLVLEHLHGRLGASSLPARRHAAYLLGLLRDVTAIPKLIDVLARKDRGLQDVVEDSLAEITKQRLGSSAKRWRYWWTKNQKRSRIEWLIDGLAAKDAKLRKSASDELSAVTGIDLGFDGDAPRRSREEARQRWLKWWKAQQAKRAMTLA